MGRSEGKIRKDLLQSLREDKLKNRVAKELGVAPEDLFLRSQEKVPYKLWVEPSRKGRPYSVNAHHFEKDIVLGQESNLGESDQISLVQTSSDSASIPFLVIELKRGVSTHDLLAYSKKADAVKRIFPYSRYILVATREETRKWSIHGQSFDALHSLKGDKPEEWNGGPLTTLVEKLEGLASGVGSDIRKFESSGRIG